MKDDKSKAPAPQRTVDELRIALHQAESNRRDNREKKKALVKGYNDVISDLDKEIIDLLDQLKTLNPKV